MSIVRFVLLYVLLSIFGLLVAVFLAQNFHTEHIAYFGLDFSINFAWVLLVTAASGVVLTFFLMLPGRIASALHAIDLEHEIKQLEEQVALLKEQRERMIAQHENILAGHERILLRHQRLLAEYSQVLSERDQAQKKLVEQDQTQKKLAAALERAQKPQPLAAPVLAGGAGSISVVPLQKPSQQQITERPASVVVTPVTATPVAASVAVDMAARSRMPERDSLAQRHDNEGHREHKEERPQFVSRVRTMSEALGTLYKSKITRPVLAAWAMRPWSLPVKAGQRGDEATAPEQMEVPEAS